MVVGRLDQNDVFLHQLVPQSAGSGHGTRHPSLEDTHFSLLSVGSYDLKVGNNSAHTSLSKILTTLGAVLVRRVEISWLVHSKSSQSLENARSWNLKRHDVIVDLTSE